jgi:phosphate:Na+ symporter
MTYTDRHHENSDNNALGLASMIEVPFQLAGGIGLFLIGMMLLTNGLVAFSGSALQQALARFTGTPFKAFLSGVLVTALIQSSTATTATLIGFVSAGFITFSQAIGVVMGASLGSTATGWLVATLGLKLNLGLLTLPLIAIGALIKILTKGRWAELGLALAGFSLIFLGLSILQDGMRTLSSLFSLADLPLGGIGARLLIMLIGFAMTVILQSSSAAVATILTALDTNNINFDQAAALTIGAAIGTTLTGALLAIGGTIHAKRTVLAHILFNAMTGLIAILLLPVFLVLLERSEHWFGLRPGALSLAVFHSMFIGLGVLVFLPLTGHFAIFVQRILHNQRPDITDHLDDTLLPLPEVALAASQRALEQIAQSFLDHAASLLATQTARQVTVDLAQSKRLLDETFSFVSRISVPAGDQRFTAQRISQLHAIDHLMRLRNRLQEPMLSRDVIEREACAPTLNTLKKMIERAQIGLAEQSLEIELSSLASEADAITAQALEAREEVLRSNAAGSPGHSSEALLRMTDTLRWLERTAQHVWRISYYLQQERRENLANP